MTTTGRPEFCLYSPASRGGAGWFVFALAQAIGNAGGRLLLIAPEALPLDREPTSPNVTRHVLISGRAGHGPMTVRVLRTLWRIASTFVAILRARRVTRRFVVTLYDWIPVLVLQFLWVRLLGGELTFIVHDATPHAWALPGRLRSLERLLFRLSYWLPQRIVVLTSALQHELAREWGRSDRCTVIPHGAFIDGTPAPLSGSNIILVFGMLRRNKRILESIEAMRSIAADLPHLHMVIAGAPHAEDPGYWQECQAALAGLGDRIQVEIGFVAEDRLRELMHACDAVLLPYEQFNSQSGVAVLASFAERVVIATYVGGIGELIQMGMEPIIVERPVTAQNIANALRMFAATPVLERRRMAEVTRRELAEQLSWDAVGRDYLTLLRAS